MSKLYPDGIQALASINLQVCENELLILLGPSGCGKTTTLRLIAGLESPTSGTVSINGKVVNQVPSHRRNTAMMFQRPALYPNRTVLRNLLFALQLRRRSAVERVEVCQEVARTLGLDHLLDRYPGQLSGGQQQRLALGRALVRQAAVLLLDEPLSNLDAPLRLEIQRELHLLHKRFPATMIVVTHDPAEAMALGDRVAILDAGILRQVGRPVQLWEAPAHRRVAELLAPTIGWLTGRLERDGERLSFRTAAAAWDAPEHWSAHAGREVNVGVRPEQVALPSADAAAQPMLVVVAEPQPTGLLVTCRSATGTLTGLMERGRMLTPGEKIMVNVTWPKSLLFDATTGALLAGAVA